MTKHMLITLNLILFFIFLYDFVHSLRLERQLSLWIDNASGDNVDLFWIADSGELSDQGHILDGFDMHMNSYEGHSFLVSRIGNPGSARKTPDTTTFTLDELDSQVEIFSDELGNLQAEVQTEKTRLQKSVMNILTTCQQEMLENQVPKNASEAVWEIGPDGEYYLSNPEGLSEDHQVLLECASAGVTDIKQEQERAKAFHKKLQIDMRDRNRDYMCANSSITTSAPVRKMRFQDKKVDVLLDYGRARIDYIHNFVTEEECAYLKEQASPNLQPATVAGKTQQDIEPSRRAKQASVDLDWDKPTNPATTLSKRAFQYANFTTGFKFPLYGQEGIDVIKYDSTDEYLPHCDADCEGQSYRQGGRVSTMVVYCEVATKGGATTFDTVNKIVVPKRLDAVFFSYLGQDGKLDDGLTMHSGCPVIEGEKWIATFWMRLGVSEEYPWTSLDPDGRPQYNN